MFGFYACKYNRKAGHCIAVQQAACVSICKTKPCRINSGRVKSKETMDILCIYHTTKQPEIQDW